MLRWIVGWCLQKLRKAETAGYVVRAQVGTVQSGHGNGRGCGLLMYKRGV